MLARWCQSTPPYHAPSAGNLNRNSVTGDFVSFTHPRGSLNWASNGRVAFASKCRDVVGSRLGMKQLSPRTDWALGAETLLSVFPLRRASEASWAMAVGRRCPCLSAEGFQGLLGISGTFTGKRVLTQEPRMSIPLPSLA